MEENRLENSVEKISKLEMSEHTQKTVAPKKTKSVGEQAEEKNIGDD
jgi:hypothetical protein